MPCQYYTPEEERQIEAEIAEDLISGLKSKIDELTDQLDLATRILCDVMRNYDTYYESRKGARPLFDIVDRPLELHEWWEDHKKRDEQRAKDKALAEIMKAKTKVEELENAFRETYGEQE